MTRRSFLQLGSIFLGSLIPVFRLFMPFVSSGKQSKQNAGVTLPYTLPYKM